MATLKLTLKSESGEGWGGQTTEYYNGFLTIDDVDYTIYKDYYQGDYTKNYDDEYLIELEPGDIQWSYRVPINQAEDTTSNFQPQKNQWKLEDLNGDILLEGNAVPGNQNGQFEVLTTTPEPVYGCTDEEATNYNPNANADDGSCAYEPFIEIGTIATASDIEPKPTMVLLNEFQNTYPNVNFSIGLTTSAIGGKGAWVITDVTGQGSMVAVIWEENPNKTWTWNGTEWELNVEEVEEEVSSNEIDYGNGYVKKLNFPSIKTPGIYPQASKKELGLNNINLQKFSLSNLNSIVRDNKIIPSKPVEALASATSGRPIEIIFNDFVFPGISMPDNTRNSNSQNDENFFNNFLIRKENNIIKQIKWTDFKLSDSTLQTQFNNYVNDLENESSGLGDFFQDNFNFIPTMNKKFNGTANLRGEFLPIFLSGLVNFEGVDYDYSEINTTTPNEKKGIYGNIKETDKSPNHAKTGTRDEFGRYGIIKLPREEIIRNQYIDILRFYCLTPDDNELLQYWYENNVKTPSGENSFVEVEINNDVGEEQYVPIKDFSQLVYNTTDELYGFEFYGLKSDKKIYPQDGFGYIQKRPIQPTDSNTPNIRFLHDQRYGFDIELDDILAGKFKNLVYERELKEGEEGYNENPNADYTSETYNGSGGYWTHEVIIPKLFRMKSTNHPTVYEEGGSRIFQYPKINLGRHSAAAAIYPVKIPYEAQYDQFNFGVEFAQNVGGAIDVSLGRAAVLENPEPSGKIDKDKWNPIPFGTDNILSVNYNSIEVLNDFPNQTQGSDSEIKYEDFIRIGAPLFSVNNDLLLSAFNNTDGYDELDFIVKATSNDDNVLLLYYDKEKKNEYKNSSYPLEIKLNIEIANESGFDNPLSTSSDYNLQDFLYSADNAFEDTNFYKQQITGDGVIPILATDHYYEYKIIQWGDEKKLLTDLQIQTSFYFKVYDLELFPSSDNFYYKKLSSVQSNEFKPLQEESSHIYNTPGIKNIKIIITRLTNDGSFILQTYLVTKNIVINDGLLSSQDFEIFGGTNFNFLPIVENQAIIGGFDIESKYDNSVSKIVKDDSFVQGDYLEKTSAKNYIEKINNGFLGKQPGQLDLGQTRVFTEPKDIYDFIGADKLEWINQGFGSLPINSLATDIFIRDDKCIVDLNPSDTEYSAIQNKAGLKEVGVIIGDYKVNQPQGGKIQKQGVMETPILDTDNEKQAF